MNITWSIGRSDPPLFAAGGRERAIAVRRVARARSMRLAVDPRDGTVRLTLPPRASLRDAYRWAESKRGWIEAQLATLPQRIALGAGAVVPFEGRDVVIEWRADIGRAACIAGDRLLVGGPAELVGRRVLRWLRTEALARLERETREVAASAGVAVGRVGVGDPRSRWGSCSASGDIRYSWRLVLAPPEVRRATVAHEVAHRLHMHHGPAFHRAVADIFGRDPAAERAWLKVNGTRLWAVVADDPRRINPVVLSLSSIVLLLVASGDASPASA